MDTLGEILWSAAFISPLVVLPLVYKVTRGGVIYKAIWALAAGATVSLLLALISFSIIFRHGMGPT